MGDSARTKRQFCGEHGNGAGCLQTPIQFQVPCGMHGRIPKAVDQGDKTPVPASPGRPARYDYEYKRCGMCNIFMACEPLAGKRMAKITERKTKKDWAYFLEDIAGQYKSAEKITLVMGNLNTHTPGSFYEAFPPDKAKALWNRFEFIYTLRSAEAG